MRFPCKLFDITTQTLRRGFERSSGEVEILVKHCFIDELLPHSSLVQFLQGIKVILRLIILVLPKMLPK